MKLLLTSMAAQQRPRTRVGGCRRLFLSLPNVLGDVGRHLATITGDPKNETNSRTGKINIMHRGILPTRCPIRTDASQQQQPKKKRNCNK